MWGRSFARPCEGTSIEQAAKHDVFRKCRVQDSLKNLTVCVSLTHPNLPHVGRLRHEGITLGQVVFSFEEADVVLHLTIPNTNTEGDKLLARTEVPYHRPIKKKKARGRPSAMLKYQGFV